MSCSPLLDGVSDPIEVLKVVAKYPVLRHSEPSSTFYPLRDKGWVEYKEGSWSITKEGKAALPEKLPEPAKPKSKSKLSLSEFFSIGDS